MSPLFFLLLFAAPEKKVSAVATTIAPAIDGVLEELWQSADSTGSFVQFYPSDHQPPTDSTVVYVLQDDKFLYFAFRCATINADAFRNVAGSEDGVSIYLDPLGSRTTAYTFWIGISGNYEDGLVLDDGRSEDESWDGIWDFAVKVDERCYVVEIRIPFNTIRYNKSCRQWGVDFGRSIRLKQEWSFWTEADQVEGHLVSRYGILDNIQPGVAGHYFELYPEIFVRGQQSDPRFDLSGSLNFKWDVSSQVTANATYRPDFAQIESDPFSLNLSQYEPVLEERRPFFVEGQEVFHMSNFGEGKGFFKQLNLFYSRRIGRIVGDRPVPITGGGKITARSKGFEVGLLGAYTGSMEIDSVTVEPARLYGVFRTKYRLFQTSEIGLLMSGARTGGDSLNYAFGADGTFRRGASQFITQAAASGRQGKKGWALSTGYFGFNGNILSLGGAVAVHDSFDISTVGYVPWSGLKQAMFFLGPFIERDQGYLRNCWLAVGPVIYQPPAENRHWSTLVNFIVNPNFASNWGFDLEPIFGKVHEADTVFFSRGSNLTVWGDGVRHDWHIGGYYEYGYNYNRGFPGHSLSQWAELSYRAGQRITLEAGMNSWTEWDTAGPVLAITPVLTPRISFVISPRVQASLFNEFVWYLPGAELGAAVFTANRVGLLFTWNFRPKSWLYLAVNDHRTDNNGRLEMLNQIGALKVKYLFYF